MITAEVAGILAEAEPSPAPGELAVRYAETLLSHLEQSWERCWGIIRDDLAPEIARRIVDGGHYFVDSHGAHEGDQMPEAEDGGRAPMRDGGLASESGGVAMGLALPNHHRPARSAEEGGQQDITLIGVVDCGGGPRPGGGGTLAEYELGWAERAQARGNLVVVRHLFSDLT